jgi:hypothetical protein
MTLFSEAQCTPLPDDSIKVKKQRPDLLRAAQEALRYLRTPEACGADGMHRDDVVSRLEAAIKAEESKRTKRQPKVQWREHIVLT